MAQVSNTDILKEIGTLTERIDQNHRTVLAELGTVKKKQDHTNGDVMDLKNYRREQEIKAEAFVEFNRQPPTINAQTVNYQQKWFTTDAGKQLLLALAGVITVIGSVIALKGGI